MPVSNVDQLFSCGCFVSVDDVFDGVAVFCGACLDLVDNEGEWFFAPFCWGKHVEQGDCWKVDGNSFQVGAVVTGFTLVPAVVTDVSVFPVAFSCVAEFVDKIPVCWFVLVHFCME